MNTDNLRKTLVVAKALAYAIETIKALPPRWQEASDMADMESILKEIGEPWVEIAYQSAKHHIEGAQKGKAA